MIAGMSLSVELRISIQRYRYYETVYVVSRNEVFGIFRKFKGRCFSLGTDIEYLVSLTCLGSEEQMIPGRWPSGVCDATTASNYPNSGEPFL